ncbi:MAG TPA: amidohydrolase family protein [Candidatus Merdenecus merdavium]|nr:amidohydrolase family protein [Candidatus Merdenecus merdavium]
MVGQEIFALKGNIIYSKSKNELVTRPNSYLLCIDGKVAGIYQELPEKYRNIEIKDKENQLIIPGLVDLHLHAPQYSFCGLGMDMELLDWLNTNTFPEESRYQDLEYARKAYEIFVEKLKKSGTTRVSVFATIHTEATTILMELLDQAGIKGYVGKVNMDRNSPDILRETSAADSLRDTKMWVEHTQEKFQNIKPIITPRFTPSCSDELMRGLGELQKETGLPIQSHLSENLSEIQWVKELCPQAQFYGDAYDMFGLFGRGCPTIMAHCVHSTKEEIQRIKENGVYIAHCPQSNMNLSSGVAPIRTYLDMDINVGLGSDVAGGANLSIFRAMSDSIQASKLRWRLQDDTLAPLTLPEAFYMATKGGGSFFGQVGSFEEGYEFDALVIDDSQLIRLKDRPLIQRLERAIYLFEECTITDQYVAGNKIKD